MQRLPSVGVALPPIAPQTARKTQRITDHGRNAGRQRPPPGACRDAHTRIADLTSI